MLDNELPPIVLIDPFLVTIPPERQREKAEADDMLINSIQQRGLLHPIIVKGSPDEPILVAGERRLDAHRKLKKPVAVRFFEQLSPIAAFEVELHENISRKQLTWQEEVRAVGKYHNMRKIQFPGWTQMATAEALHISQGWLSMQLAVAEELGDEEVATCPTLRGAFNLLSAKADRARMAAQSRGLEIAGAVQITLPKLPDGASKEERTAALLQQVDFAGKASETVEEMDAALRNIKQGKMAAAMLEQQRKLEVVSEYIHVGDFLEWAATYEGPKFDLAHVDFPYGKGYSGARTRKTSVPIAPVYADDPDIFFGLVDGFTKVQDRILHKAAHVLMWFDDMYRDWMDKAMLEAGWNLVQPYSFIWTKGYQGIASDVRRRPRHCYETCRLYVRGDRKLVKLDKDHFECLLDEKLHINQKPLAMLKHLLSMYVDEHTAVLDPTCGSGSALAAAAQLKAARFFGCELDPNNAEVARLILQRHMPVEAEPEA